MRIFVASLFGLANVVASSPLFNACAALSRFSPRTCEILRLTGLCVVLVVLAGEWTSMERGEDPLPLLWTAALAVAVAAAKVQRLAG